MIHDHTGDAVIDRLSKTLINRAGSYREDTLLLYTPSDQILLLWQTRRNCTAPLLYEYLGLNRSQLWSLAEVKGRLMRRPAGSDVCTKPCSPALKKSTLRSIDLARGLIDAVFKNSLVWGMGELRGGVRSCRAHLSLFTEPEASSQRRAKRPDGGPPWAQRVTLSLCTRRTQMNTPARSTRGDPIRC